MVIVEFSVNDMGVSSAMETYEGLIRQILKSDNKPGVLTLDMMNNSGSSWQEHFTPVNEHYAMTSRAVGENIWSQGRSYRAKR
jgi:hypothetical protein